MIYACQVWGQENSALLQKIENLQDKALRIINFLPNNYPISETYKKLNILKLRDFIKLQNTLFVKKCLENEIPSPFKNFFEKSQVLHQTRTSIKNCVSLPLVETETYGTNSIKFQAVSTWNKLQQTANFDLTDLKYSEAKQKITELFMNSYIS